MKGSNEKKTLLDSYLPADKAISSFPLTGRASRSKAEGRQKQNTPGQAMLRLIEAAQEIQKAH